MNEDCLKQKIAITEEAETAIKLIREGLRAQQAIDGANDFLHLPLLLLSNGLERLMKVVICFKTLRDTGCFPARSDFKPGSKGHQLWDLHRKITGQCFSEEYLERTAALQDKDFVESDPLLQNILDVLSEFGWRDRYFNLNIVLGKEQKVSPVSRWDDLEMRILREEADWEQLLADPKRSPELYNRVNGKIVCCIERFVRALTRLFTIGELGPEAGRLTGLIQDFFSLRDEQLGMREY